MKIGVLSDTHLYRVSDWLKNLIEITFKDTDLILHAGDIVSGPVLAYLESSGVLAVRGNMDSGEVGNLPDRRIIDAEEVQIGLVHGWGSGQGLAERIRPEFGRIDCLVFGHSHVATNRSLADTLLFNPGTAGDPSGVRGRTAGLLHVQGNRIRGEIIHIA